MPRIIIDPNNLQCPDYTLPIYANARAAFVNDTTTEAQAAAILANVWQANNTVDIQQWQDQMDADAQALEDRQRDAENERVQREEAAARESEEQRRDEMKKNKSKYAQIPARGVPRHAPAIAAYYATRRMEKGEYVPLWYYTNKGLQHALLSYHKANDEAMALVQRPDGSTSLIPAAASSDAKGVIDDQDIEFEEFCIASSRMVEAMGIAEWPADRIRMMTTFWSNLQSHPFRSSPDDLDRRTLLLYQAEQRRQWHFVMTTPNAGYDLSAINEELLRDTKERLYWRDRDRKDKDRELLVSTSLSYLTK
jgi:hypothetical protein